MGPAEAKLRGIRGASAASMRSRAQRWSHADRVLTELLDDLERQKRAIAGAWTEGSDSGAALLAFETRNQILTTYQTSVQQARQAAEESASAIEDAQEALDRIDRLEVPEVVAKPAGGPPDPSQGASPTAVDHYAEQLRQHESSEAANAAVLERREALAAAAVGRLDGRLQVGRALLSKSVFGFDDRVTKFERPAGTGSATAGAGGAGPGTVVGGSTSTAGLLTGTPAAAAPVLAPSSGPGVLGGIDTASAGQQATGSEAVQKSGQVGGGGAVGGAASAGLLAAGKNALGKLTGVAARAPIAPTGTGRTAGMQTGPTLGRSGPTATSGTPGTQPGRSGSGARPGSTSSSGRAGSRVGTGGPGGGRQGSGRPGARSARNPDDPTSTHRLLEDDQWGDDEETSPGVIA